MLFLTLVFEKDREKEYMRHSKVALQAADNVLQWNIVDGLLQNLEPSEVQIINSIPVGNYPRANRKIAFPKEERQYRGARLQNVGFWNLPLLKPIIRFFSYVRVLKKNSTLMDNAVLVYGLYLPQLLAIQHVKRKHPLDVCVVIDDLPAQFGIISGNWIKVFVKKMVGRWVLSILNDSKIVDRFVLLSEHMKEALHLNGRGYCVVEGIANPLPLEPVATQEKKIIFYAGTLNKRFGILTLLDAFSKIEGDGYALWICGGGDAEEQVKAAAREDKRIQYYGFVSKTEADRLRNSASVLVNPRNNEGAYTRYSFPSKTIEYLLAEKPVVMYRLDGIPSDYDPWLYYIPDKSAESMAQALQRACQCDSEETKQRARQARQWVLTHKNPAVQVRKILELFNRRGYMDD